MEPNSSRLRQNQQKESQESLENSSTTEVKLYHSVEELLRHDAEQNPAPEALAQRVAASSKDVTSAEKAPKSWWQRLVGE